MSTHQKQSESKQSASGKSRQQSVTTRTSNDSQYSSDLRQSNGQTAVRSTHRRLVELQQTVGNRTVSERLGGTELGREGLGETDSNQAKRSRGLPPHVRATLGGRGSPLADETRTDMESRFGYDFGDVRVHTGGRAVESARRMNARAYTYRRNIVFGLGEYAPETDSGRRLLAHELAHVVQQGRGGTARTPPTAGSAPERAADRAASAVVGGNTAVQVPHATAPGIARQPRSLIQSLDPTLMTGPELTREIRLIREWLIANPVSSQEREHLRSELTRLERYREAAGLTPPRYNLTIAGETLRNATEEEVLRVLQEKHTHLRIDIDGDIFRHEAQKEIRDEHQVVGFFSDLFGGVEMPPMSIWKEPKRRLSDFKSAIEDRDIERALRAFQSAVEAWAKAHRRLYKYIHGTIEGAERAITGLEITRDVSFATVGVTATVVTGGAASGALIGAGVTATGAVAQQAEEVRLGLRKEIDWGAIAFDALFEIVTSKIPGLGDKVVKRLLDVPGVPSLGRRAISRLTGEVVEVLQDQAMGAVQIAAAAVFDNLQGAKGAMSVDQVLDAIARQLLDPEQALRGYLVGKAANYAGGTASRRLPRTRGEARVRREAEAAEAGAPPTPTPPEPTTTTPETPPLTPETPATRPMERPEPVGGGGPPVSEAPSAPRPRRPTRDIRPEVERTAEPPELPTPRATEEGGPRRRPEAEAEAERQAEPEAEPERRPEPEPEAPRRDEETDLERAERVRDTIEDTELPEATVFMPPPREDTSSAEQLRYLRDAHEMFENTWRGFPTDTPEQRAAALSREAALYRNPESGEYIIVQGTEDTVFVEETSAGREAPAGAGVTQRWKEILEGRDVGRWELVAHSHPAEAETGTVSAVNRFPSGAQADMGTVVWASQQAGGEARSSRIFYETPTGPNHTDFGYDPSASKPFFVDFPSPDTGQRQRLEFDTLGDYHDWMRDTFGVDMGSAPELPPPEHISSETEEGPEPTPEAGPTTPRTPVELPDDVDPDTIVWVNTQSGIFHLRESRYFGQTQQGEYMTAAEGVARGARPSRSRGGGRTPQEIGRLGEITRFMEVGLSPKPFTRIVRESDIRRRVYDMVESGELPISELAGLLGPNGAEQVYFRTPRGGRYIDHVFLEGRIAVLRESKQVSEFRRTEKILEQLRKDEALLNEHDDIEIRWRVSGRISESMASIIEEVQTRTRRRFVVEYTQ